MKLDKLVRYGLSERMYRGSDKLYPSSPDFAGGSKDSGLEVKTKNIDYSVLDPVNPKKHVKLTLEIEYEIDVEYDSQDEILSSKIGRVKVLSVNSGSEKISYPEALEKYSPDELDIDVIKDALVDAVYNSRGRFVG